MLIVLLIIRKSLKIYDWVLVFQSSHLVKKFFFKNTLILFPFSATGVKQTFMKGEFLLMSVLSPGVVKPSKLSTRHFVIKERKRKQRGYRLYLRSTMKLSLPDLFMIVSVNLWDFIGFHWIYNRVHCHVLESATCYCQGGKFIV